tara:strand:+ start:333 stop:668 length:336 start_codon:yes stop_codon:yes gene_type:complete
MKITIIADDGIIGIDGVFRKIDLSSLDPDILAFQWDKGKGDIEWKNPRRNEKVTEYLAYFGDYISMWKAAAPPPPGPPKPIAPAEITGEELFELLKTKGVISQEDYPLRVR